MEYGADFIAILHTGNQVPQPIPKAFLDAGDGQGELQILSHSGGLPDHGPLRQSDEGQEFRISAQDHTGCGAAVAQLVTPTVSGEGETLRDRQIDRIGLVLFPDGKLYRICNVGILTVQLQLCLVSRYPYQRIHAAVNQHRLRIDFRCDFLTATCVKGTVNIRGAIFYKAKYLYIIFIFIFAHIHEQISVRCHKGQRRF